MFFVIIVAFIKKGWLWILHLKAFGIDQKSPLRTGIPKGFILNLILVTCFVSFSSQQKQMTYHITPYHEGL